MTSLENTESTSPYGSDAESLIDVLPIKKAQGRTSKTGIPRDENYFNEYYRMRKEYIVCECGYEVMRQKLQRHLRTAKHLKEVSK